jgi:hypothetical protein
VVLARENE